MTRAHLPAILGALFGSSFVGAALTITTLMAVGVELPGNPINKLFGSLAAAGIICAAYLGWLIYDANKSFKQEMQSDD